MTDLESNLHQVRANLHQLPANLRSVQERIRSAALRSGRNPQEITLVAVSKTFSPEMVVAVHELGVPNFGENRVEEAVDKIRTVHQLSTGSITWHMLGHIQHRKIRLVVEHFDMVHSVDTAGMARRLNDRAVEFSKTLPVLLEVNTSGEAQKFGFMLEPRQEFYNSIQEILAYPQLDVQGLMTMAPIVADPEQARPYFRVLRELRDELRTSFPQCSWRHLSMGMTDDFEAAIAEGATIVRIGRAIFGSRNP